MKKQLSVGIVVENPNDIDDFTTVIYLPSKDHEIQDAFHQVRIESPDTYREYTITQCKMFPGLEYARLDSPSIEELNFFAQRLDSLSCYKEGDRLLHRLGATVTDYGIISKRCGGLYETITHDVPEENPLLTERFELVEVNEQTALFTEDRITASDVPDGLFKYDLRSGETMDYTSIETNVMVNHAATILVKKPFDFGGLDYIPLNDETSPGFLDEDATIGEYMDTDYDQEEEITLKMGGI